jgi:tungstate transport system substrate-binding protein
LVIANAFSSGAAAEAAVLRTSVITIALALAAAAPQGVAGQRPLTIVAAPPVTDSGLIDALLARFTARSGIATRVLWRPAALPLSAAERGDVDVVIVNDAAAAHHVMESGHGVKRRPFMREGFAIVGPAADPAGIRGGSDAAAALRSIARLRQPFVSRGEEAGADAVEQRLWAAAHVNPKARSGHRYVESGLDMRATLELAVRRGSYALADAATWFALADHGGLAILLEGDPRLSTLYEAILIDPARHPGADAAAGTAFIDWLASPEGQAAIADFAIGGRRIFIPASN